MGHPKISIVLSTYNREHLLGRSLSCYLNQNFPLADMELIIIDDWSEDKTQNMLDRASLMIPRITVIKPPYKEAGIWRDCAATINIGLRAAKGEIICATHPEVMVGKDTLVQIVDLCRDNQYFSAKPYYLTPDQQLKLDSVDWVKKGPMAVRDLPRFYEEADEIHGNPDYTHHSMDKHQTWGSWVFGAMTRKTWKEFGGMHESDYWGSVDISFITRRHLLEIPTVTMMDDETRVIHQNHDIPSENRSITPREMGLAMRNAGVWTPETARLNNL